MLLKLISIFLLLLLTSCSSIKKDTKEISISNFKIDDSKIDSILRSSLIKKLIVIPGYGTEKIEVKKTKIETIFVEFGKSYGFSQGIIDFKTSAIFENNYNYSKQGLEFTTYTDVSKGQDIKNAIISTVKFRENSNAQTSNGLSIGDNVKKIKEILGNQDEHRDIFKNITYFYYAQKGINLIVDDNTNKITEIIIYKPRI